MRRISAFILVTAFTVVLAYFGAFHVTKTVMAHGTHCNAFGPPECNQDNERFFVSQRSNPLQTGGLSNGVRGGLSVTDIAMYDPATSNVAVECHLIPYAGAGNPRL